MDEAERSPTTSLCRTCASWNTIWWTPLRHRQPGGRAAGAIRIALPGLTAPARERHVRNELLECGRDAGGGRSSRTPPGQPRLLGVPDRPGTRAGRPRGPSLLSTSLEDRDRARGRCRSVGGGVWDSCVRGRTAPKRPAGVSRPKHRAGPTCSDLEQQLSTQTATGENRREIGGRRRLGRCIHIALVSAVREYT